MDELVGDRSEAQTVGTQTPGLAARAWTVAATGSAGSGPLAAKKQRQARRKHK